MDDRPEDVELGDEHAADACWRCVLDFDTDDASFRRGFEAGAVWSLVDDPAYDEVASTVHADNAEMVLRMAEATHRSVRAVAQDEAADWLNVVFGAVGSAP